MEEKMIEYMQSQIDEVKQSREDGFPEWEKWWYDRYLACASMFKHVTGKEVVLKRWVVSIKGE